MGRLPEERKKRSSEELRLMGLKVCKISAELSNTFDGTIRNLALQNKWPYGYSTMITGIVLTELIVRWSEIIQTVHRDAGGPPVEEFIENILQGVQMLGKQRGVVIPSIVVVRPEPPTSHHET